jgi:hypothetical protein
MSLVSKLVPLVLAGALTTKATAALCRPSYEPHINFQTYDDRIETSLFIPLGQNPQAPYELYMTFANPTSTQSDLNNFEMSVPSPRSLYFLGMGLATMARKRR